MPVRKVYQTENPVSAENNINGRVHLDSADFRAGKVLLVVDVVNVIVPNDREYTAQMSDNTALFAVMDVATANDVRSNVLLRPAFSLRLQDRITLGLRAVLHTFDAPLVLIFRLQIFAEGDAVALGIRYFTVLDDPAL